MVELQGVSKKYNELYALHPLDLVMAGSRTTALLGSSGSGKSTLLRLVMGLVQPDTGQIVIDGQRVRPENVLEVRRRMGYMIQDGGLFPHLTAGDNVSLMARWLRWTRADIQQRFQDLCALTQLSADVLRRYPVQLSGGQRQRVALMRALFLDPDLLLLDEPMGALDPLIRSELQGELRKIFAALGKTVILVTHDIAEASYLADDIILLHQGSVAQRGTLAQMIEQPSQRYVTDFIQAQRPLLAEPGETT